MPYIKGEDRTQYDKYLDELPCIGSKGELEYCIFKLMLLFMVDKAYRYSTLHDCTYAAQHCADEFRRRFLDRRENAALDTNGDIEV
jgi:hypothetical protein